MKKNLLLTTSLFFCAIIVTAQNTSPYWSLAGNNNARADSKLGTTNNYSLKFYTNNLQRMIINSATGYVGIGNSVTNDNSTRVLNLVDDNAVMRILRVHPTSAPAVELLSRTSADGPNVAYWDMYAQPSDASFRIRDRQTGTNYDRLTILHANGNVGIGTTAPLAKLHLSVNDATSYSGLAISNLNKGGKTLTINQGAPGKLAFTEPSVIDLLTLDFNTQNVGIGIFNPQRKLDVDGNIRITTSGRGTTSLEFVNTSPYRQDFRIIQDGFNQLAFFGAVDESESDPNVDLGYFSLNPAEATYTFTVLGSALASGGVWENSDVKLKKGINDFNSAMDIIKQLKPKTYFFKTQEYKKLNLPVSKQYGFIADDLEKVLPELVKTSQLPTSVNTAGERKMEDIKAVNYTELIPILTKALQEQDIRMQAYETKIDELIKLVNVLSKGSQPSGDNTSTKAFLGNAIPNPANKIIKVNYAIPNEFTRAELVISNMSGQKLKEIPLNQSGLIDIDISKFGAGIYFYTLIVDGNTINTKKMVVVR